MVMRCNNMWGDTNAEADQAGKATQDSSSVSRADPSQTMSDLVDRNGREALLRGKINSGESLRLSGTAKGDVKLSNSGGSLILYDQHGCVVDHVTWSRPEVRRLGEDVAFMFDHG